MTLKPIRKIDPSLVGKLVVVTNVGSRLSIGQDERVTKLAGVLDVISWAGDDEHPIAVVIAGSVYLTSEKTEFESVYYPD